MRRFLAACVLGLALLGLPTLSSAQSDPDDLDQPDTVDLVFTVLPDFTTGQLNLEAELWVVNDSNSLVASSVGFAWDNPNLQMDSAVATQLVTDAFDLGVFLYQDNNLAVTNANQQFLFGSASLFGALLPDDNRRLWATYYFTLSDWDSCDSIVIDTLQFNAGTEYSLVGEGQLTYRPVWTGAERHRDTSCAAPANLLIAPDSLHFEGVEGGASPTPQTFSINSDNVALDFTLVESIPWIVPSPTLGTTPTTVNLIPNSVGLSAGSYIDSIRVNSPGAANSPQYVVVTMTLEPPPPLISVSPTSFTFNAIAGTTNPDSKILTITNTGGSILNWTTSHTESWLTLTPASGTDSTDVDVAVDITGLPFGTYYDTIVVSDPNATNSPKRVPVQLSVASDLPVIAVDSAFNYIVVDGPPAPRTIHIRNEGAGSMNFWVEESSSRILSTSPASGTAPEDVVVSFKVTTGTIGDDDYDTLWVYSDEAINSPFPVVFRFHYTDDPAWMSIPTDTAVLTLYECEMGVRAQNPATTFSVINSGGDDPMTFQITGESDLFSIQVLSYTAPSNITLLANYLDLPLGDYYDTLIFYAEKSIPAYDTVIVHYEVIEATETPKIWVSNYSYTIPAQENGGPIPSVAFQIRNENGGCMPWSIEEDIPWMFPEDTAGLNPASLALGINPAGYTLGEYPDSFTVIAPTASNSPGKVRMRLQVWRFHGDCDWNGRININDMTYLVAYLFKSGPLPRPTRFVGDLNCNKFININDLTYFVDYFFKDGPIPCGNPYK